MFGYEPNRHNGHYGHNGHRPSAGSVAVVGGGIFGSIAALDLRAVGYEVDLFERQQDLLLGASRCNQARLHSGYHYPRSEETVNLTKTAAPQFTARFPGAVVHDNLHYYGISNESSMTNGVDFLAFCNRMDLEYIEETPAVMRGDSVDVSVRVPEGLIDVPALRRILRAELSEAGVGLYLGVEAGPENLTGYDWTVAATYCGVNDDLAATPTVVREIQFEVCEIAMVRLPEEFDGHSFVIMDGPFVSLDPSPGRGYFHLYDVKNSLHSVSIGLKPEYPAYLQPMLDVGMVRNPVGTHFAEMQATACRFFPGVERAEHLGSAFTVRAVLPYLEGTDARPTIVSRTGERQITIFPGKIDTAVTAGEQVVAEIAAGEARRTARQAVGLPGVASAGV